jgi:hypothetical protein
MIMKRTVYLPDDLAVRVGEYLKLHRELTFSELVQESLRSRVMPRDPSAILKLAGVAKEIHPSTAIQPEDQVIDRER